MGMLHVHHLVKRYVTFYNMVLLIPRHVNKEKVALSDSQARFAERNATIIDSEGKTPMRIKDVYYWYIDYRDFADVVKYRIAMMRKGIDQKVKEVSTPP
jgi:transcription initiation factor TFIIE subunit alpha